MELRRTGHHHAVRVTLHNARPHADQVVHKVHAAFKHLFKEERGAARLGRQHDQHTHQIGGEHRPRTVLDLGNRVAEIIGGLEPLTRGQPQAPRLAVEAPFDPETLERPLQHLEIGRLDIRDRQFTASGQRRHHVAARINVVRPHPLLGAMQRPDSLDRQQVRTDAADAPPHRIDHATEILHMRLAGRVVQERRTLGQRRRHDQIFGCGHARLIHQDTLSLKTLCGLEEIGAAGADRDPEPPQAIEMGIDAATSDHIATRRIELGGTATRQQRPGEKD